MNLDDMDNVPNHRIYGSGQTDELCKIETRKLSNSCDYHMCIIQLLKENNDLLCRIKQLFERIDRKKDMVDDKDCAS